MSDQPITDCPACGRQRISVAWCPECGVTTHPDYKRLEARIAELEAALRECQKLANEAEGELPFGLDGPEMEMVHEVEWRLQHIWAGAAAALKGGDDERKD